MLGYLTLYFKLINEKEVAYAKFECDFAILPTEEVINKIKESVRIGYKEKGFNADTIEFCTVKEYKEESNDKVM